MTRLLDLLPPSGTQVKKERKEAEINLNIFYMKHSKEVDGEIEKYKKGISKDYNTNLKRLLSYIKSRGQEWVGIVHLKNND
mgnify:CR=1 FL=1